MSSEPASVRLLVAASRHWTDRTLLENTLELAWHDAVQIHGPDLQLTVVHGDCPTGGDPITHAWATARISEGVYPEPHPANWDTCTDDCPPDPTHRRVRRHDDIFHPGNLTTYCPVAGPRRNVAMVNRGAALCVAAPLGASRGTRGCAELAAKAGIPVQWI